MHSVTECRWQHGQEILELYILGQGSLCFHLTLNSVFFPWMLHIDNTQGLALMLHFGYWWISSCTLLSTLTLGYRGTTESNCFTDWSQEFVGSQVETLHTFFIPSYSEDKVFAKILEQMGSLGELILAYSGDTTISRCVVILLNLLQTT